MIIERFSQFVFIPVKTSRNGAFVSVSNLDIAVQLERGITENIFSKRLVELISI